MNADELARSLSARFLEGGNYEALGVPFSPRAAAHYAQAAAANTLDEYFEAESGFAGLAVHSVGYTAGKKKERVIIYVTRGSKRALNALPEDVGGVGVEALVMGRVKTGPAPSVGGQGAGQLFERDGRIACGSSCAPSNENYAGTFGALVRSGSRMLALSNNHVFAACNHTPVGMPILAPSTIDARPGRRAPTEFCRHEQIVELRSGDPGLVSLARLDAAVAAVSDPDVVSSWQGDDSGGFDTPSKAGRKNNLYKLVLVVLAKDAMTSACKMRRSRHGFAGSFVRSLWNWTSEDEGNGRRRRHGMPVGAGFRWWREPPACRVPRSWLA